jgi:CO/xanthine dehydrogenase Mo-binding subunit
MGGRVTGHMTNPRVDLREKVTGRAVFVTDIELPGMLASVHEDRFTFPSVSHYALEPHTVIADFQSDQLTVIPPARDGIRA